MKSLIQEAATIEKAVGKAWNDAGMPSEFKIKILYAGTRGILGLFGRPSVISLSYDPRKQTSVKQISQKKDLKKRKEANTRKQNPVQRQPFQKQPQQRREAYGWNDSLVNDVKEWLKDVLKIIGIKSSYEFLVDRQILRIRFKDEVLDGIDEERMLFASLANLLLLFLKKKYRKKLMGYRIVFASKRFEAK
jgi:predicted RNA-binding protein Jag